MDEYAVVSEAQREINLMAPAPHFGVNAIPPCECASVAFAAEKRPCADSQFLVWPIQYVGAAVAIAPNPELNQSLQCIQHTDFRIRGDADALLAYVQAICLVIVAWDGQYAFAAGNGKAPRARRGPEYGCQRFAKERVDERILLFFLCRVAWHSQAAFLESDFLGAWT